LAWTDVDPDGDDFEVYDDGRDYLGDREPAGEAPMGLHLVVSR